MSIDAYLDEAIKKAVDKYMANQALPKTLSSISEPKHLLTKAEVADLLSVSSRTVDRMIAAGKLPHGIPIAGGHVRTIRRWRYDDIARLI